MAVPGKKYRMTVTSVVSNPIIPEEKPVSDKEILDIAKKIIKAFKESK